MKIGLGLYRHMLTRDYSDFARQVGCTQVVVHLVDYFNQGPSKPRYYQPTSSKYEPWGLAGDEGWTHYSVVADVRFLSAAAAAVMGRIDSADVFQDGNALWPSGYILRVNPNGAWELLSTEFNKPTVTLTSGFVAIDHNQ